jgi:hypothetical protein
LQRGFGVRRPITQDNCFQESQRQATFRAAHHLRWMDRFLYVHTRQSIKLSRLLNAGTGNLLSLITDESFDRSSDKHNAESKKQECQSQDKFLSFIHRIQHPEEEPQQHQPNATTFEGRVL